MGRACAEALAEVGVTVVIADVNAPAGHQTAESLRSRFAGEHRFHLTDVTLRSSVENLVAMAEDTFGRIDILVNNAGILIPRLLVDPAGREELTEEIWDRTVAVNQKGMFLCAQAVARLMIRRKHGGVIINMASESGQEGSAGQSAYAATKGAIFAMTRSWAKELGRYGIRVVGVAPGILEETALRDGAYERALAYARGVTVEHLRATYETSAIPLGRVGRLQEVANVVCFLASDRASYLHGTTINVSGGKSRG